LGATSYYLETYGCALNTADSDMIAGHLSDRGVKRVLSPDEAHVIILNTCGVKEPTEDRIIHRLEELSKMARLVIVAGCLPIISLRRVQRAIPNYAAILGPQSIETLGLIVDRVMKGERGLLHLEPDTGSKLQFFKGPPGSVVCTVPLCEGCLGSCTYCAVKFARGNVKSYSIKSLHDVVCRCVHQGYREIRLTGQDTGVYGHETGETLVELLQVLEAIKGAHMFRLGMFNPHHILASIDEFLQVMSSPRFFKFFHIPLQSGSNSILGDMERRYSVEDWQSAVRSIQRKIPLATIATDIIVGFPGETDEDFNKTLEVISNLKPPIVNISKYGDRPGTVASRAKNKVNTSVKKDRSRQLSALVTEVITEQNATWLGWTGPVLVVGAASKGGTLCRNTSYKAVIIQKQLTPGSTVDVEITMTHRTHLAATVIP